ncbi:uncharacterized protein PV09_03203 [Verruconis gallopava]|jgi:hypothetical protein|uniref:DUF1774-domain-containing protein n=1 Tax=Verruconis gallopava TaxID=253628 RepID=A0A0D2B499_9PEZI|nr:uncharacterized protein PV09_03203 [Verruconis gallopava]KIW06024.1 hypothetical protein PV09_03203 [Verruconis gallopava]
MSSEVREHIEEHANALNPNHEQRSYSRGQVILLRIVATVSWLVLVVTSIYYAFEKPHEGQYKRRKIWNQNWAHHTPFALNAIIVSIYWIVLYILQIPYIASLYSADLASETLTTACNLASTFTYHNLLQFGFIHLWCRSYFGWALLLQIVNFFNLTFAYFKYPKTTKLTHIAVVAAPLAWTFVSLYWTGAVAVHAKHLAARIVANVFVWTWLVYGYFYLIVFKDWALGFSLSVLSAALGVAQFLTVIVAVQWIEAFIIMALLFLGSLAIAVPGIFGKDPFKRADGAGGDREREPLLGGENA